MRHVVTMRLEEEAVDDLRDWAKAEGRSLANLIECWWRRERDRRLCGEVTLDLLDDKLDRLMGLMESSKKKKPAEPKKTALDIDLQGIISEASWKKWINHLHSRNIHLNHYMAGIEFEKLVKLDRDEWDCELLIDELIKDNAGKIYLPFTWVKESRSNKS